MNSAQTSHADVNTIACKMLRLFDFYVSTESYRIYAHAEPKPNVDIMDQQYNVNDFVCFDVDEGRGRRIFFQSYYGKITEKYVGYHNKTWYDVLKFKDNTTKTIDFDLSNIAYYVPHESFRRIDMHNEMKQKRSDSLDRCVEMVISKTTTTKIAIK